MRPQLGVVGCLRRWVEADVKVLHGKVHFSGTHLLEGGLGRAPVQVGAKTWAGAILESAFQ